jgi:rRNA maturation RNase YbeY
MIYLFSEQIKFDYPNPDKLISWIIFTAANEGFKTGDINIIFSTDEYLYDLNRIYLNHDYYTDVITFPYNEPNKISGDIFISIERVKENAQTYNTTFLNELNRVIIHGILHLIGYNDKTEEEQKIMRQKEDFYLQKLQEL